MRKLVEIPCDIGDTIYEIIVCDSDKEVWCDSYIVEDISLKAIKFGDDWKNRSEMGTSIFLNKEDAVDKFEKLKTIEKLKSYKFLYENIEV